jgi:hypothetical protein
MVDAVPLNAKPLDLNRMTSDRDHPEADVYGTATGRERQATPNELTATAPPVVREGRPNFTRLKSGTFRRNRHDDPRGCGMHPEGDAVRRVKCERRERRSGLMGRSRRLRVHGV